MARTIIQVIHRNSKTGERQPVLAVKQGRKNTYATAAPVRL